MEDLDTQERQKFRVAGRSLVLGVDGEVLKTNEWKPLSSLGLFRKIERAAQHLKSKKKDLDKMTTREKRRGSSFYPVFEFRIEQRSEERRVGKECRSRWSPD